MKAIAIFVLVLGLFAGVPARSQDAATEERLNKLAGQIEDIRGNQEAITRRIEALAKEIESVRTQAEKPAGNYASDEDLKRLAEAVKEIDRKRLEDYEKIRTELKNLGKTLAAPSPAVSRRSSQAVSENVATEKTSVPDKYFEYQVKKGDTLAMIVQAYREQNIKVSTDQILKANPGLKPERMRVGQTIKIPPPQS
ncbi:MAG TPA: LysM domain-containing protein [Verrucomicrobiae bacterium]|nr:LysM domain-containing protein [Verrucomicrobiae bacterium]